MENSIKSRYGTNVAFAPGKGENVDVSAADFTRPTPFSLRIGAVTVDTDDVIVVQPWENTEGDTLTLKVTSFEILPYAFRKVISAGTTVTSATAWT